MANYIDKQSMIGEIEARMKSVLTIDNMETMQTALLEVLSHYDVVKNSDARNSVQDSSDLLQMFIEAKTTEGRTAKTTARYIYILNRFFADANISAQETTVYHIRNYIMQEKKRGIADSTLGGYRYVFTSFFGWLYNEGLIQKNPCTNVGVIKQEKKVRKPFSNVELQKVLEACDKLRDKAIVLFLLNTGCRVSELCGINVGDIDLKARECVVYGKGKKERTVYFDEVTMWVLENYISGLKADEDTPLFAGKGVERLHPSGVRVMLKRLEKRSGVENVHPHRFRRTFATGKINKGMQIQEVAVLLGHEKLDTTMKYVYQSKERVKSSYEHYSA